MDRPAAKIGTRSLNTIPRGWVILGLAVASWGVAIAVAMLARSAFNSIFSVL